MAMEQRLSRITTCWSKVFEAHQGGQDTVAQARAELLERYCGAIYRYAVAVLQDANAAEEVLQEFAFCFVRGDFGAANPDRGRFRDLVKTVLFHLIVNYQRQRSRQARYQPLAGNSELADPHQHTPSEAAEVDFIRLWREELLERTWAALHDFEKSAGNCFYSALRLRAEQPQLSSGQLAQILSTQLEGAITSDTLRQTVHRARDKFAQLLISEIARSIDSKQREPIEQELVDLDLLVYCKSALEKMYS
jgi:RNA polymerase sigma-70 factor (ECF subfamily)